MNSFDVYFLGQIMDGNDQDLVKSKVSEKFKIFGDQLEHMFSGEPVRVKTDVDVTLASRFRELFRELGALVEIVPAGDTLRKSVAPIADNAFELLPANTGSLIDTAPKEETYSPVIDAVDFGLSPAGALLPEAHPESPLEIDLSHMETVPVDAAPLAHFSEQEEELTMPDISHMEAADPAGKNLVEELKEKEAQPLPDISHLDAKSGSLEDCKEEKEPVAIADLSEIKISYD